MVEIAADPARISPEIAAGPACVGEVAHEKKSLHGAILPGVIEMARLGSKRLRAGNFRRARLRQWPVTRANRRGEEAAGAKEIFI